MNVKKLMQKKHNEFHNDNKMHWLTDLLAVLARQTIGRLWLLQYKFNVLGKLWLARYRYYEWAIVRIQRWYRLHRAQYQVRSLAAIQLFQTLEFHKQQQHIKLQMFLNDLLRKLPERMNQSHFVRPHASMRMKEAFRIKYLWKLNRNEELQSYGVKEIEFPLARPGLRRILRCVRREQRNILPPLWIIEILKAATQELHHMGNINEISSDKVKEFIICGSLFGNLKDLIAIFRKNGMPCKHRYYIFNGDFVDYGPNGIEVLIVILACFLVFRGRVFLNRGDHEDYIMNSRYGFQQELQKKYPREYQYLEHFIDGVFRWLPLATRIDQRVFIAHGGVTGDMDINKLATIRREAYVSIHCPQTANYKELEWLYLYRLLSNSVCTHMERKPLENQQCTLHVAQYFDAKATQSFCDLNKLDFIVTSNDYMAEGWQLAHNDRVWTIFSTSYFYGINEGACMRLNKALNPEIVTYGAAPLHTRLRLRLLYRIQRTECGALHALGVYLNCKRHLLSAAWEEKDMRQNGLITIKDWCECMSKVSGITVPWHLWQPKLAPTVRHCKRKRLSSAMVDYKSIYYIMDSEDVLVSYVYEQFNIIDMLCNNSKTLEMIFRIIDKQSSGVISLQEVSDLCEILRSYLDGSDNERHLDMLIEISKLVDRNDDGFIDFPEFCETFELLREFLVTKRKEALFQCNTAPLPRSQIID